jgi:hypothetical protein
MGPGTLCAVCCDPNWMIQGIKGMKSQKIAYNAFKGKINSKSLVL